MTAHSVIGAGAFWLTRLYAAGQIHADEVCALYLERIARLDGALGAYVMVDGEGARDAAAQSAARWAAGRPLSPLDGCPVAIKANIAVQGWPWHAGVGALRDRLATEDAVCVARLRRAGAVILGLLNMDEGAFGAAGDNPVFGRICNPWSLDHTAGGSSGGAGAAVAAGLCAGALGTDTLGSVRIPAGLCGVYGHKPARALISTAGVIPLSSTLDHVGVLGRSAADCAALLTAAAGLADAVAPGDGATLRAKPIAALDPAAIDGLDPQTARAYGKVLVRGRAAGLQIDMVRLSLMKAANRAAVLATSAEGGPVYAAARAVDPQGFSDTFCSRLDLADRKSASDLAPAYGALAEAADEVRAALAGYGALLSPTTPRPAPAFPDPMTDAGAFTTLANVSGLPATAFPAGFTAEGMPLSVQVMAWTETDTLGLAALLALPGPAPPGYD